MWIQRVIHTILHLDLIGRDLFRISGLRNTKRKDKGQRTKDKVKSKKAKVKGKSKKCRSWAKEKKGSSRET